MTPTVLAITPRATLWQHPDGRWIQARLMDGGYIERAWKQLPEFAEKAPRTLDRGHIYVLDDRLKAELERDGYSEWFHSYVDDAAIAAAENAKRLERLAGQRNEPNFVAPERRIAELAERVAQLEAEAERNRRRSA